MNKSHTQCNKKGWTKKIWIVSILIFSAIWISYLSLGESKTNASWQPHRFINQDFWNANPSSGNIITALFGDQSDTESSPYTRFWTGMNCNITENDIVVVNTDNYTTKLNNDHIAGNKIYLLLSGEYSISTDQIKLESCSAIIGKGNVTFKKEINNSIIYLNNKSNIIIDNIKIDGMGNQQTNQGIHLDNSHNNTINNVEVYKNNNSTEGSPIGIHLEKSNYNSIHNSRIYDNGIGIKLLGSQHNYINKSQIYNHKGSNDNYGIFIKGEDGTTNETGTHSNHNILNNNLIYNNNYGVYMQGGAGGDPSSNMGIGLKHILFGVYAQTTPMTGGDVAFNMITNSQTFNSKGAIVIQDGQNSKKGTVENNMFFNNTMYNSMIIYTGNLSNNNSSNNNIMRDAHIFNSSQAISGTQIVGSGNIYMFNNSDNGINNLTGTYNLHTGYTTSYHWMTNPVNVSGRKLLNGTDRASMRGTGEFTANPPIKYIFGKNIPRQEQPMRYNENGTLEPFGVEGLDRDPDDFIASVNMEINPEDENLVNYYYVPDSEFAVNWNENNCSLGAFTVEHIDTQAKFNSKVLNPLGHTIYVLDSPITETAYDYGISGYNFINIQDNCIAIVNKAGDNNQTIQKIGSADNPLIKISGGENIILDGLNLDGLNPYANNPSVNSQSNYGILLEKSGNHSSSNNTFNNIKSYNHKKDGIRLGLGSSYNTIMNTQTWNNTENGIEIFQAGLYNIINNSLSYNNSGYGIRFGNISKYNTINNSQFFNNNNGGIFADFTSEQNILNNIHIYNNKEVGLDIKRSSQNSLHKMYIYHNKIGIKVRDTTSVNNKFNGELRMFDNRGSNLSGTNGDDNFLSAETANYNLAREPGNLIQEESEMSCAWATNPKFNNTWFFNIESGCISTGKQNITISSNPNNISYLFGLGINKQIAPVGYKSGNIELLNNQFNESAYIGEINPIIWTNPGAITISGQEQNLDLEVIHEMEVTYSSNMINHNFDVKLTGNFSGLDIHLEIKKNNNWINIGTGQENIDFLEIEGIKIVLTTPNEYYQTVSGIIYIGTQEYGSGTKQFEIRTKPDPTPPTITWSGNINPEALWYGEANTWQAVVSGVYNNTTATYSYVTGADDCTTGIAGTNYNGSLKNIVTENNYNSLNDKYVCIIAKDNTNGQYATGLSDQIKISKIEFIDPVALGPVNYDIIDINFQHVQNYGYKRINSNLNCNATGMANTIWEQYDEPIVINNTSLNGKYMCLYGEDETGIPRYVVSNNKLNINNYSNIVRFIDDVSPIRVTNDVISIYFNPTVTFSNKKYKWVNSPVECSNSGSMQDYTGSLNIDHQGFNGLYFCLYTREQNGTENYLVSTNKVKVDTTNPMTPTIIAPTNGQNLHRLVIQALGASDGESGLAGYEYEISDDTTFLDVLSSGIVYTTEEIFSPIFDLSENNYAIQIRSIDNVGNTSERSNKIEFNYKTLANFAFENVSNAQLGTSYISNQITMGGLGVNETIVARVTNGVLLRNGNILGTSGLVKNSDKLSIKMNSSNNYNELTKTELRIANRIVPRAIKTAQTGSIAGSGIITDTGFNLTSQEMLIVQMMFNSIVSMYQNPSQLHSFLITMSSMLQDNIALAGEGNAESLRYLLYLIQQYIATHFNNQLTGNIHKAPNCKEYTITYDTGDNTYYSPNTVKQVRFGSRDELVKYLDVNNPGDCHINVYGNTVSYNNTDPNRHIAPNGKVYNIQLNNLGYSSPEFITVKYFASTAELRTFIDKNNPAIVVRDHTVDTTFDPITHTAPNGKSYKIYKTNRGYMSYKLMKVQYYGSLDELKNHIDKNNKK